jgi:hypothetical protein
MLCSTNILSSVNQRLAGELARSYNVLYPYQKLKLILQTALPEADLNNCTKYDIHKAYNDIVISNYKAETKFKSLLVDQFIDEDIIAAFEVSSNTSRIDFLKINGHTISYEIKSDVDNLVKIQKQVSDYSKLFDYNYVVIGEKHLAQIKNLIPDSYGIVVIKDSRLLQKRKARKNQEIDASLQLNIFTKKELKTFFGTIDKELIVATYKVTMIADIFREMLKSRYLKRWEFFKTNKDQILPLDYQYFFNHNVSPKVIYSIGI